MISKDFLEGQVVRLAGHPSWRYFDSVARKAILTDLARALRSACSTEAHARAVLDRMVSSLGDFKEFPTVTDIRNVARDTDPNPAPAKASKVGCQKCTNQPNLQNGNYPTNGRCSIPGWLLQRDKAGNVACGRCTCSPFFDPRRDAVPPEEELAA